MKEPDTTTALPEMSSPPRWKRWLFFSVLLLAVLPLAAWACLHGLAQHQAQQELDEAIAEISRIDPGWRIEELEAARKSVTDDQNAALVVMEVKELLPKPWQPAPPNPSPQRLVDAKRADELRAIVESANVALAKARSLSNYPAGRFPRATSKDPLDPSKNCNDAPDVALLLRMQAMVLAQDEDADGALQAVMCMAGAARAVGDEPRLIAQMARSRCRNELINSLERVLGQGQPSEAGMAKLQQALEEEERTPCALLSAQGERAGHHQLALEAEAGEIDVSKVLLRMKPSSNPIREALFEPTTGVRLRKTHVQMLYLMTDLVALTRLPPEEQGPPNRKLSEDWNLDSGDYTLFQILDKRVLGMPHIFRRNLTYLRCAMVALAVERYRRANQRWPETLDALVPGQLAQLPTDPFSGRPLHYEHRKDGVTIYSKGKDSNNGNGAGTGRPGRPDTARLSVRLWDVSQRRQQALPNDGEEGDMFDRGRGGQSSPPSSEKKDAAPKGPAKD
jgi:hypothetical protein